MILGPSHAEEFLEYKAARSPVKSPLRIFHITAICNLESIARSKKLYSNALLQKKKINYGNIAYQGAQGKRATKMVARPPGGSFTITFLSISHRVLRCFSQ